MLELVRQTKGRVQLLVTSAHWGGNWGSEVPAAHRRLARSLIEAGADVVFGHSAHIFRGVEIYRMQRLSTQLGTRSSWIGGENALDIPICPEPDRTDRPDGGSP
ncbi:CapA family protein [Burkholderia sp. RS01]|uniref:CapA family protein n=1 Tax=Bacteria TaxID=2 RepID=UPI0009D2BEDC|nr:CapA family protein [Arthrobacter sp. KBS0703]